MKDKAMDQQSFWEQVTQVLASIVVYIKTNNATVFVMSGISWVMSTYVDFIPSLLFFLIATTFDTISRIDVSARQKKIKFRPWKRYFWNQIDPELLRVWFDKVFKQYLAYVLIVFAFDSIVLKSKLSFDVGFLRLDIPTALVIFFAFIEIFSAFRNQEEVGRTNYLKVLFNIFSSFIPEKIKHALEKTIETTDEKNKTKSKIK